MVVFDRQHGYTLTQHTYKGDGYNFLVYTKLILHQSVEATSADRRVFPGYPLLIAIGNLVGIPLPWSAMLITLLTAAFSCGLAATLCADKRIGWAMATLTPTNLLNTTMVMNEAAMTICIL